MYNVGQKLYSIVLIEGDFTVKEWEVSESGEVGYTAIASNGGTYWGTYTYPHSHTQLFPSRELALYHEVEVRTQALAQYQKALDDIERGIEMLLTELAEVGVHQCFAVGIANHVCYVSPQGEIPMSTCSECGNIYCAGFIIEGQDGENICLSCVEEK